MNFLFIMLIIFVAIISLLLVWLNLPGTFIFLFFSFLLSLFNSFDIISNKILIIALSACILLELIEYLLSMFTIKVFGGKNSSAFLSIVGGLVGTVIGSFIFPVIGSLIGLLLGSFCISYFNERRDNKTHPESMKIATSSILGYVLSKGLKSLSIIVFSFYITNLL